MTPGASQFAAGPAMSLKALTAKAVAKSTFIKQTYSNARRLKGPSEFIEAFGA
jgi:hypothetical protein